MKKSAKVVHFTSVHSAFDARIFYKECQTLAKVGYEVVLIVPYDHDEIVDCVKIRAIAKPRTRYERATYTAWKIYRAALQEDAQLYHFHDPELMGVGIALRIAGKKIIYDIHEDLSQQITAKAWFPNFLKSALSRNLIGLIEQICAGILSGRVAATPIIASRFRSTNTVIVQNFPILEEFAQGEKIQYTQRPMEIAYVGKITESRGILEMVRAVQLLVGYPDVSLVLGGRFSSPSLENEMRNLPGWAHVEFQGWLDRSGVQSVLGRSRVGLVILHPTADYLDSYPVKLFEYMAAGLPVIVSDFPFWRQILKEIRCGIFVDPLDPIAIAEAIRWIFEHPEEAQKMGSRGQQAVLSKYNWHSEARKLLSFYAKHIH